MRAHSPVISIVLDGPGMGLAKKTRLPLAATALVFTYGVPPKQQKVGTPEPDENGTPFGVLGDEAEAAIVLRAAILTLFFPLVDLLEVARRR